MTKYNRDCDEIFYDMQQNLEKSALIGGRGKTSFLSINDYKSKLDCNNPNHKPSSVRISGAENFEIQNAYKAKCGQKAEDKEAAVDFTIQYMAKIADELDSKGFVEIANVIDDTLQKVAGLKHCEDCENKEANNDQS